MPYVISSVAMVSMWSLYIYNNKYGLLKNLFEKLGFDTLVSINWTDNNHMFLSMLIAYCFPNIMIVIPMYSVLIRLGLIGKMYTMILLYVAASVPYTVYFMLSFFSTVPSSLEEAAMIDGCTPYQAFWKIMFPMAQPGIITVTIFNFRRRNSCLFC